MEACRADTRVVNRQAGAVLFRWPSNPITQERESMAKVDRAKEAMDRMHAGIKELRIIVDNQPDKPHVVVGCDIVRCNTALVSDMADVLESQVEYAARRLVRLWEDRVPKSVDAEGSG